MVSDLFGRALRRFYPILNTAITLRGAGVSFRMNYTRRHSLEANLFWKGLGEGWEGTSLKVWSALARQSTRIFDVGANTGPYALLAAASSPNADVLAFEPFGSVARDLEANVALNGFSIRVVRAAVSDQDGRVALNVNDADHTMASVSPMANGAGGETVRALRLENMEGGPPDLMKIDVEGHEPAVLRGMGDQLKSSTPTILIEILEEAARSEVQEIIATVGYRIFHIFDYGEQRLEEVDALRLPSGKNRNFLLTRLDNITEQLSDVAPVRELTR